jgi:hypothetical protein
MEAVLATPWTANNDHFRTLGEPGLQRPKLDLLTSIILMLI